MNLTVWQMYWLTRLDGMHVLLWMLCIASLMFCVVGVIAWLVGVCDNDDDVVLFGRRCVWRFCVSATVFGVLLTLIPTTKQAAVIYCVPAIVNSEFVNKTLPAEAGEVYGLAKAWLTEQVEKK